MAVELFRGKIPIIRRSLNEGFIRGTPDAEPSFGCIERDFAIDPVLMSDSPAAMQLIDPSEYDARYDEQEATESSLEHMYLNGGSPAFEFLDQDGFPDCWFHSTAHALMLDRLKQNLPPVRFNAVAGATLLRQLNGGWSGLSMKFLREHGCPVIGTGPGEWPYQSRNGRDTPELRASMAKYKAREDWYDLGRAEWDQKLSDRQLATCGFMNMPAAVDYNAYGHAMCQLRKVRIERGAWGKLTLNSWQGFGYFGLCVIPDTTANPNNAVALRVSSASV
jgi:hypothetical protein